MWIRYPLSQPMTSAMSTTIPFTQGLFGVCVKEPTSKSTECKQEWLVWSTPWRGNPDLKWTEKLALSLSTQTNFPWCGVYSVWSIMIRPEWLCITHLLSRQNFLFLQRCPLTTKQKMLLWMKWAVSIFHTGAPVSKARMHRGFSILVSHSSSVIKTLGSQNPLGWCF